jgi:hypothetical protein
MFKKANILRLISLLLILLTLLGTSIATYRNSASKLLTASQAKKSVSSEKEKMPKATIQAVSFEAIVSLVHFNLSQDFYFNFTPTFSKLFLFVHHSFEEPAFINTYFENTFGHHIAINAP